MRNRLRTLALFFVAALAASSQVRNSGEFRAMGGFKSFGMRGIHSSVGQFGFGGVGGGVQFAVGSHEVKPFLFHQKPYFYPFFDKRLVMAPQMFPITPKPLFPPPGSSTVLYLRPLAPQAAPGR
jgi:hypothetical protein